MNRTELSRPRDEKASTALPHLRKPESPRIANTASTANGVAPVDGGRIIRSA